MKPFHVPERAGSIDSHQVVVTNICIRFADRRQDIIINERKDITAAKAAKSQSLLLEEDLLCARHCFTFFTCINS